MAEYKNFGFLVLLMEKCSVDFWKTVETRRESLDHTTPSYANYSEEQMNSLSFTYTDREAYCAPLKAGSGWYRS